MSTDLVYAYLFTDFGAGFPHDPLLAAQTGQSFPASLSRGAEPVALGIAAGRVVEPVRIGRVALAAGDVAHPLWTLVDTAKNVTLSAYGIEGRGGRVAVITTQLPLRAGQDYHLSLPVAVKGEGGRFHGGFHSGTLILTVKGKRPIAEIEEGDLVWTGAERFEPVTRHLVQSVAARGQATPIRFRRGFWGLSDDLLVSGNLGLRAEVQGESVLVPASALVERGHGVFEFGANVTWHHLQLAEHGLILAQGLACETLWAPPEGRLAGGAPGPVLPRLSEAQAIARLG